MLKHTCRLVNWLGGAGATSGLGLDLRPSSGQFVNVIPEGTQHSRRTAASFHPTPREGAVAHAFASPETRQAIAKLAVAKPRSSRWHRHLRADIYDELLKLPLRFALHDFTHLQQHYAATSGVVGTGAEEDALPHGIYAFGNEAVAPSHDGSSAEHQQQQQQQHPSGGATWVASERYYSVAGKISSVGYAPPLGPADALDVIPFHVHRTSNGVLPGKIYSMHAKNLMPAFYMKIGAIDGDVFRMEEELMKIFPTKKIFVRHHTIFIYNVGVDGREVLHHWLLGLGF